MTFGITAGGLAAGLGIAGGINSLTGGAITNALGFGGSGPGSATAQANPMAPYQAQLAQMYAGYLQPGQSANIQQMPGYTQFQTGVVDPAMAANKASAATSGMLYSGNEEAALQKLGQQSYSGFMTNYLSQLSGGAGVGFNPAAAAQLGMQQQQAGWQALGQGIGAAGTAGLFGTNNMYTNPTGAQVLGMQAANAGNASMVGGGMSSMAGGSSAPTAGMDFSGYTGG